MSRLLNWHNALLVALAALIGIDLLIGLDPLLNVISSVFVFVLISLTLLIVGGGLAFLGWLTVKEQMEDTLYERTANRAWLYKLCVLVGFVGIMLDGAVGLWNAFNYGIRFSTAVEKVPFSGIPIYILIASLPIRWIETAMIDYRARREAKHRSLTPLH